MGLILGWYYHLPPCVTDAEFEAFADGSLALLLRAHASSGAPCVLAVTGHALEQLARRRPALLARVRQLIERRVLVPAATTYYEVAPHLIPPSHLAAQIDADLDAKSRLLGASPTVFWPGNFCWSPLLGPILARRRVGAVLLDEAHLRGQASTQIWKWLRGPAAAPQSWLADTGCSDEDALRPYRLAPPDDAPLALVFRSAAFHRRLSFGVEGALHRPWDGDALDAVIRDAAGVLAAEPRRTVFCGDDGDRINATSFHPYTRLLDTAGELFRHPDQLADAAPADHLDFLGAYAPPELAAPGSAGAQAYLALLGEIYRQTDLGRIAVAEVLPLQDVFPLFWTRTSRAAWFYRRGAELLQRTGTPL